MISLIITVCIASFPLELKYQSTSKFLLQLVFGPVLQQVSQHLNTRTYRSAVMKVLEIIVNIHLQILHSHHQSALEYQIEVFAGLVLSIIFYLDYCSTTDNRLTKEFLSLSWYCASFNEDRVSVLRMKLIATIMRHTIY